MGSEIAIELGLHEPVVETGQCLSHAVLRVWVTTIKNGPEITLVNSVIPLGAQKINMAKKVKPESKLSAELADLIEGDLVILEPQLDIKVQDVIPKAFCSCGFSLSMRFMTRVENSDQALKLAAAKLNNSVADVFDELASVFNGVSPYVEKK